jgi:hypothetical protein
MKSKGAEACPDTFQRMKTVWIGFDLINSYSEAGMAHADLICSSYKKRKLSGE